MLVKKEINIPLFDLVSCFSDLVDLVTPELVNHHKKVAYVAYSLAAELGMGGKECNALLLAGKVHDLGAISYRERIETLHFELKNAHRHAQMGGELLKDFAPLAGIAEIVRFHHVSWDGGNGKAERGKEVPIESHILHLADRVAVLVRGRQCILNETAPLCREIESQKEEMFMPEVVDAFLKLAQREYFWLDLTSPSIETLLRRRVSMGAINLNLGGLLSLAKIFARIIDFRSSYTATHSSGVAASAATLARLAGYSERECKMMSVAGFLHDLGKLAVPTEILEKRDTLSPQERNIIMCHPFHTYRTLENINDLSVINAWAGFHHEHLDGRGYPFRLNAHDLSLGSRIMSVADVFTALTEDRPYRQGMGVANALSLMTAKVEGGELDGGIVALLEKNVDEIDRNRQDAQAETITAYNTLNTQLDRITAHTH